MATYCNEGEIARVTFPDASIRDYSDTPITITAEREPLGDTLGQFGSLYIWYAKNATYTYAGIAHTKIYNVYFEWVSPPGSFRQYNIRSLGHTNPNGSFSSTPVVRAWAGGTISLANQSQTEIDLTVVDFYLRISNVNTFRKYRIKVFNVSGTELFNQVFDTGNYSVECIENCPPNHIKCDDGCCLDCEDVFYKLCNIKRLFI